jgi:hypothetical protein
VKTRLVRWAWGSGVAVRKGSCWDRYTNYNKQKVYLDMFEAKKKFDDRDRGGKKEEAIVCVEHRTKS